MLNVNRNGKGAGRPSAAVPDPELVERARRRRFSAEYTLQILALGRGQHAAR